MTRETSRFLAAVDMLGDKDCWPWTGNIHAGGYGRFIIGNRAIYAHRYAYRLWVAPLREGMEVMHTCDNPPCVNPKHLVQGTHADNMHDRDEKGRGNSGKRLGSRLSGAARADIQARRAGGEVARTIAADHRISVAYVYVVAADRRG